MTAFTEIKSLLHIGETIKNWTKSKGYIGEPFDISIISSDYIIVKPLKAKVQKINKRDFDKVLLVWKEYCNGTIQRQEIRNKTRYSKYIISIFHHLAI
jgi:hypothetical protein